MTNKMFKPEPDIDIRSFPKISQLSKRAVLTYLPKTEIQLASYNNCTTKHHEINYCPTLSLKQNRFLGFIHIFTDFYKKGFLEIEEK